MANINIKLSQNVVNAMYQISQKSPAVNGSLGNLYDQFAKLGALWNRDHPSNTSFNFSGSSVQMGYADGATVNYAGVMLANPNATQGTATASSVQFYKSAYMSIVESGVLGFNYSVAPLNGVNTLAITSTGVQASNMSVTTQFPTNSPSYDSNTGNVVIMVQGAVNSDNSGNNSGTVNHFITSSDKLISNSATDGSFSLSANALSIGQGLGHATVSGTMTATQTDYRDGSFFHITGVSVPLAANQQIDGSLLSNQAMYSGNDVISVDLPATVYSDYLINTGNGNDTISINGGGGRLNVKTGNGNNTISIGSGSHHVDCGTGVNTAVFNGQSSAFAISKNGAGYQVSVNGSSDVDVLTNVSRLQFADMSVGLDISGTAGQAYRLYQAAFNRKPDLAGLGYWIHDMDKGSSLTAVAAGFFQSAEFQKLYGTNPSTTTLITNFYQNVLHRAPDQAGFDYWNNQISTGKISAAGALASFCESTENQAQVIGAIQNGIDFKLWLG